MFADLPHVCQHRHLSIEVQIIYIDYVLKWLRCAEMALHIGLECLKLLGKRVNVVLDIIWVKQLPFGCFTTRVSDKTCRTTKQHYRLVAVQTEPL